MPGASIARDAVVPSANKGEFDVSHLAVLLDEAIRRGGEMQIKRTRARHGFGSAWVLSVWSPAQGDAYPTRECILQAPTSLDLLRQLEAHLREQEQEHPQRVHALQGLNI